MRAPPPIRLRKPRAASTKGRTASDDVLWLGGVFQLPFYAGGEEGADPHRPVSALWLESETGLIVGQQLVAPDEAAGVLATCLRGAMVSPMAGPPRQPARVRVATEALAAELREAFGPVLVIEVAATPELDALVAQMVEALESEEDQDEEDASYLDGGRFAPERLAALFRSARDLHRAAPWRQVEDGTALRVDAPALGIEGGCLALFGAGAGMRGFLLFPSYEAYERCDASDSEGGEIDLGGDVLSLAFMPGAELPEAMRREVAAHRWPLAGKRAYPVPERRERDGRLRPLTGRDLEVLDACAAGLSRLFAKEDPPRLREGEALTETYTSERVTLSLTLPYVEAADLERSRGVPWVVPERAAPRQTAVGRNEPCPCGSGRKYKKCHLRADEEKPADEAVRSPAHDLDERLAGALLRFAKERHAAAWQRIELPFRDPMAAVPLSVPWTLYEARLDGGETVASRYLAERGRKLPAEERAWLEAQSAAWLSIWEVREVDPGRSLTLRDALTGEERTVREASASRMLVVYDALLARVVDHEGEHLLCGTHPLRLTPGDAAEALRRARARLQRKTAVAPERLRSPRLSAALIRIWEAVADAAFRRAAEPVDLRNSDGAPLLLTRDVFALVPGADAGLVTRRITSLPDAERAHDDPQRSWLFFGAPAGAGGMRGRPIRGRVWLADGKLHVEANSRERADALRARIEETCAGLVRYRARELVDPQSEALPAAAPLASPPPEAQQLLLQWKDEHYADWIDHELPALGGVRPRDAVRTAAGREAVDLLLKEMENQEQRGSGAAAFDFGKIRRQLGLA